MRSMIYFSLMTSLLLFLFGCAPGTYDLTNGQYYPTPKDQKVQLWERTKIQYPPVEQEQKPVPAQPQSPPKPGPNNRVIVLPS